MPWHFEPLSSRLTHPGVTARRKDCSVLPIMKAGLEMRPRPAPVDLQMQAIRRAVPLVTFSSWHKVASRVLTELSVSAPLVHSLPHGMVRMVGHLADHVSNSETGHSFRASASRRSLPAENPSVSGSERSSVSESPDPDSGGPWNHARRWFGGGGNRKLTSAESNVQGRISKPLQADPGDWTSSPEWWGTQNGGWGRGPGLAVFDELSASGNGRVCVTAHPTASKVLA